MERVGSPTHSSGCSFDLWKTHFDSLVHFLPFADLFFPFHPNEAKLFSNTNMAVLLLSSLLSPLVSGGVPQLSFLLLCFSSHFLVTLYFDSPVLILNYQGQNVVVQQ